MSLDFEEFYLLGYNEIPETGGNPED
jgi:hypothetical protein